jgi:hypothetical protein
VEDLQAQIQQIQQQLAAIGDLKTKVADLQNQLDEAKKEQQKLKDAQAASKPSVSTIYPGSKLTIDGRLFTGLFDSKKQGPYPNWTPDVPDARLKFTFSPSNNVTLVSRLNLSNLVTSQNTSTYKDIDYFYLDYTGALSANNTLRLGQHKIDFGQEDWVDNSIENMLVSVSVSHVAGYVSGFETRGTFGKDPKALQYDLGLFDEPQGTLRNPTDGIPFNAKIAKPITDSLFASVSYYNSQKLQGANATGITFAELSAAPTAMVNGKAVTATSWERQVWEADLRYNYGKTGVRSMVPTGKLPPFMLGATYGQFNDGAVGVPSRSGKYWFGEAMLRLTGKLYAAARCSKVQLDNGELAILGAQPVAGTATPTGVTAEVNPGSGIAVNSYTRTAIGLGYVLTDLTQLKAEYAFNSVDGGSYNPALNQLAVGIATKF